MTRHIFVSHKDDRATPRIQHGLRINKTLLGLIACLLVCLTVAPWQQRRTAT